MQLYLDNPTLTSTSSVKMYFIVNRDLKMGVGKTSGQVGHAAARITRMMETRTHMFTADQMANYHTWVKTHETKIVLGTNEALMDLMLEKYGHLAIPIIDAGRTQIAPESFTVMGFIPLADEQVPEEIKGLKLL